MVCFESDAAQLFDLPRVLISEQSHLLLHTHKHTHNIIGYRRDFDSHCDGAPSKVLLESKNFLRPGDFFLWLAEAAAEPANLQNQMAEKLSQSSPLYPTHPPSHAPLYFLCQWPQWRPITMGLTVAPGLMRLADVKRIVNL